jgi:hypothetical protein
MHNILFGYIQLYSPNSSNNNFVFTLQLSELTWAMLDLWYVMESNGIEW